MKTMIMQQRLLSILAIIGAIALVVNAGPVDQQRPKLRGVTIRISPYIEEVEGQEGKFKGFIPDLLDLIAEKVGFDYELYLSPDGRYGNGNLDGNVTGMIGEVYNKRADFAAADLTVTELRQNFITFTEPFMVNQLAALIRREDAEGLSTLEDLANLKEKFPSHKPIAIGTLKSGATNYFLSKSNDTVAQRLYEHIKSNENSLVPSISKGVERVDREGGYAFIMESPSAEHEIANNCKLTMLLDWRNLFPRKYAFALPKESQYIEHFNMAIKQLHEEGKIMELRRKYWPNNCSKSMNDEESKEHKGA